MAPPSHASIFGLWLCVAIVGSTAAADQYSQPQKILDRCWLPFSATQETLGLFHFDEHDSIVAAKALQSLESNLLDDDGLANDTTPTATLTLEGSNANDAGKPLAATNRSTAAANSEPAGQAVDASRWPRSGTRVGAAVFLSTGRFDGSLHLAGGPCGFRTPPYPELTSGKAFTIDASIRPEGADGSTTVATEANAGSSQIILHMPNRTQQGGGYEVRRLVDGHLEVLCGSHLLGVSTCAVPNRSWTHVAMIVTPPRATPGRFAHIENQCNEQVILVINGAVDATFEHPAITPELRRLSGQVFVGNDAAGSAGFVGDIDEVRVSKGLLKFYDDHRDEFFADAGPEVGPPVMRDPFEMILHESFDIAVQPPEHPVDSAVRGSCSLLGDGHGIKTLPLNASIDLTKGTLEIWIRPDDWDNRQEQQLQQPLFSIPVVAITAQASQNTEPKTILTASLHSMKPVLHAPPAINPGTWHHLVLAWEGDSRRAFLDGAPLPNGILAWSIVTTPDLLSLPIRTLKVGKAAAGGDYRGEDTFFDELRLYRRPFTPIEMVNAFRRFVPGGHVDPLPFAFVDWGLNMATQSMTADIELLDARRDAVASVEVTASGPGLTHRVTLDRSPSAPRDKTKAQGPHDATTGIIDGHARLTTTGIGLEYGKHTLSLRFLDGTGALVETLSIDRERLIPPWWHSTVGLHEGIPPPGFEPVRVTKEKEDRISVELSERRIDIDARGWPAAMVSKAANMLAGPIQVEAIAGGATLDWQPRKEPLAVEESAADRVRIRGGMTASGWAMDTETTIECDGLVRIATAVTAPQAGELERLTVTIPLKQEHATLLGFWTGNPDFRNACRYGDTPPHQGIVFASTKPWAARSTQIVGTFIPFVSLADNERGLNWFAENDRHWTKSALVPAIEIERLADKVLLRLTLVHEKTAVDEPLEYVFGLQLTPVKRMPANRRSIANDVSFEFVDGFSKQDLKNDNGNHMNFAIAPANDDYEAAAERSAVHRKLYDQSPGYRGPILYIDRSYVRLPANASEYAAIWQRGGLLRYEKDARDCYAWTMNQWLSRKLIAGIYIDDCFIVPSGDPDGGLAYRLPDGRVQPGFDFFAYREMLKRLRWLFHDNNMESLIWMHMTNTFYLPCLSFADILLDGESAFPNWGENRDFLRTWSMDRLRYNNPDKWGVVTNWMFKIGLAGGPMPNAGLKHFEYQQIRALYGGLMVHDVGVEYTPVPGLQKTGVFDDTARFVGYWSTAAAIATHTPDIYPSTYSLASGTSSRAVAVIVNRSPRPQIAELVVDPERLGLQAVAWKDVRVRDIDTFDPPMGEDLRTLVKPKPLAGENSDADPTGNLLDKFESDIDREKAAEGKFLFTDHNFERTHDGMRLQIRPWDYRLIEILPGEKTTRNR